MSQFLGRHDCIESLRKDLIDLQGAVLDVFSRTGPVHCSSWKFPDKLSCHLDMVALLEKHDFAEGEEEMNQHSHIVLLELVIDRLLLLLQSFDAYVKQQRSGHDRGPHQRRGRLSVGLIVIKYWTDLLEAISSERICKDTGKPTTTKLLDWDERETVSLQVSPRNCSSACSPAGSIKRSPQSLVPLRPAHSAPCYPTVVSVTVSCQTVESSLVPCGACHQVQAMLRRTGEALIELLQGEGLPSSLQPLAAAVEDALEVGEMSEGDVAQWTGEQLSDMRRLAKHLRDVRGTVQPLTEKLAAAAAEREELRCQMDVTQKHLKEEVEKRHAAILRLEASLQDAQKSVREAERRLQEEQHQFQRETSSLRKSNAGLEEKVAMQQDALQTLECERNALQDRVTTLNMEEEACCRLREKIQQLESQISESQLLLDKEKGKYLSACRQQESMRAKQTSLLKRVDALDEECEELQIQLRQQEETEIDLRDQMRQTSEEKARLQAQLALQQDLCSRLQDEKQTLETRAGSLKTSVAELEEMVRSSRESRRLLVAFPELSPHAPPQSTGNVLLDMEQQLQANCIRIRVLEQENAMLYSSLVKLRERAQHNAVKETSPQPSVSLSSTPGEKQQNHRTNMQMTPLQSSSAAHLAYGYTGKEGGGGESDPEPAGAGNHVSTASPLPPPHIHLQTLHLHTNSTAAKIPTKAQRMSHVCQTKSLKWRKK